ncbi:MAG: phage virion morphogenesis protein [Luteimonas sp.]|nr:phage virion morphogenesis protein [Luteimonas sp.]
MTEPLTVFVDTAQADALFGKLIERGSDLTGLMRDIGEAWLESTWARFDAGVGPDGIAWEALADGSGRTPLNDTGRMRDEIFPTSGADWMELSATARQARWHQEGTDPFEIRPKDKKALAWAGGPGPRGKVNHPGLPARPFMGASEDDLQTAEALAVAWLDLS